MSELQAMLDTLPRLVRRSADVLPGSGTPARLALLGEEARVVIRDGVLLIAPTSGATPLVIDLTQHTLTTLTAELFGPSFYLLPLDTLPEIGASSLDEIDLVMPYATFLYLGWHTNPVHTLLKPVAIELAAAAARGDLAEAQLNLLRAAGWFPDYWGTHLGARRHAGESDETYTARQLDELLRQRENNEALGELLEHDVPTLRPGTEVHDQRPDVLVVSDSPLRGRPLAGWRYNALTVLVRVLGFPSQSVLALARAHVAAGVTVLVQGEEALGEAGAPVSTGFTLSWAARQVGPVPAMQIGVGAIGRGKIGPP